MRKIIFYIFFIYYVIIFSNIAFADINYFLTHSEDQIHVRAEFKGYENQEKIKLIIPSMNFATDYSRQIKNINIINGIYNAVDNSIIIQKNKQPILEYDVKSLTLNNFIDSFFGKSYNYIDKEKFYILGQGFFIYPLEEIPNQKVSIEINSSVKKIAYNLKPYFGKETININFDELKDLIILGNEDFYIRELIPNVKLIIWSKDTKLAKQIGRIMYDSTKKFNNLSNNTNYNQVAIFIPNPIKNNQSNKVNYLYNLRHIKKITNNNVTSKLIKNTVISFVNSTFNDEKSLYNLINYQNIYFWLNSKLVKYPRWFAEGFADYYMDKINYYFTGDKNQLIDNYNLKLKKYFLSPFENLDNKDFSDNKIIDSTLEVLSNIKGYLIAGQLDSIIDLDKTLKNIIAKCLNSNNSKKCEFTKEFLFAHTVGINDYQKEHINKLFTSLDINHLTNSFLNIAYVKQRPTQSFKYDNIIINSILNGSLKGNYLNNFNSKYQNNIFYSLLGVKFTPNNRLLLFISNNNLVEKFLPDVIPIQIMVPYYQ